MSVDDRLGTIAYALYDTVVTFVRRVYVRVGVNFIDTYHRKFCLYYTGRRNVPLHPLEIRLSLRLSQMFHI